MRYQVEDLVIAEATSVSILQSTSPFCETPSTKYIALHSLCTDHLKIKLRQHETILWILMKNTFIYFNIFSACKLKNFKGKMSIKCILHGNTKIKFTA